MDILRKYNNILIALLLAVGIYHVLVFAKNNMGLDIDKKTLYPIYYISWNLLFISSMVLIYKLINNFKGIGGVKYTPLIIGIYPAVKIVINILCLFKSTLAFINSYKDFICMGIISLIVLIFIAIKYGTMD